MMVIEERMPAGTSERRHLHMVARQFFYVLTGALTMELEGVSHVVTAGSGIEIPPQARHQARNDSPADIRFLVVSTPSTRGDRIELDEEQGSTY
ncbi:cupin domain-containing protein [Sphingomonas sp. NCPPB 2930]|uniref:cupin domain-containing protein n=1 Tax=Sphingomonas sp. NCPPB 2930 TaxID=3162788 RepID=UPI0036DC9DEC